MTDKFREKYKWWRSLAKEQGVHLVKPSFIEKLHADMDNDEKDIEEWEEAVVSLDNLKHKKEEWERDTAVSDRSLSEVLLPKGNKLEIVKAHSGGWVVYVTQPHGVIKTHVFKVKSLLRDFVVYMVEGDLEL